jgi:hypothetical protein
MRLSLSQQIFSPWIKESWTSVIGHIAVRMIVGVGGPTCTFSDYRLMDWSGIQSRKI